MYTQSAPIPTSVRSTTLRDELLVERPCGRSKDAETLVVELARALHARGAPAHRLEGSIGAVARELGAATQVLATPTAILIAFEGEPDARIVMMRETPGEVELSKLSDLSDLIEDIVGHRIRCGPALERVRAIVRAPRIFGPRAIVAAYGLASGCAARLFGGGPAEIVAAALLAIAIGTFAMLCSGRPRFARLLEPIAACVATVSSAWLARRFGLTGDLTLLSSLIVLLPGFTLTVAMSELAERHLGAGTARFAAAAVSFLGIGLGVGMGARIAASIGAPLGGASAALAPGAPWSELLAVLVTPLAFLVLFQARPRDAGWITLAGIIGFGGARLGALALGPELGVFVGAVLVGSFGNALARLTGRPASATQVPGMILLLPGSLGFKSVSYLMSSDVLSGVEAAFRMMTVGGALVGGLLLAGALVPPGREL